MFNKLRKKQQSILKEILVIDKSSSHSYPPIVQEIHKEFHTMGDVLLKEAHDILNSIQIKDKEKSSLLISMGFTNTPEAKEYIENQERERKSLELATLIEYYRQRYPFNKFITEDAVKQICEKYSLICGEISQYKGFVPKEKLLKISNFKLNEVDKPLFYIQERSGELVVPKFNPIKTISARFNREGEAYKHICDYNRQNPNHNLYISIFYDNYQGHSEFSTIILKELTFKICAPLKDMDMTEHHVDGYKLLKHNPDPVVLQPIQGGYLIVCAWGDEASDSIVVNSIEN